MGAHWTKFEDAWLVNADGGFEGWAGPYHKRNRQPFGFTMNYSRRVGRDGAEYGGGGWFPTLEQAKSALASLIK